MRGGAVHLLLSFVVQRGADAHVDATGGVVAYLHRLGSVGEEQRWAVAQGGCEGWWAQAGARPKNQVQVPHKNGSRNGASKQGMKKKDHDSGPQWGQV